MAAKEKIKEVKYLKLWIHLVKYELIGDVLEFATDFAKQKCKEQRELVANKLQQMSRRKMFEMELRKEVVINTPEPKM